MNHNKNCPLSSENHAPYVTKGDCTCADTNKEPQLYKHGYSPGSAGSYCNCKPNYNKEPVSECCGAKAHFGTAANNYNVCKKCMNPFTPSKEGKTIWMCFMKLKANQDRE